MKNVLLLMLVILIAEAEASGYNVKDITKCSKGDSFACNRIGTLYEYGKVVKKNLSKAKQYYKKSCQLESGEGCQNLAQTFIKEEDYHSASAYYSEACDLDNSDACNKIAFLYEKGKGVKLNYSQAKKYHEKACTLGNVESCKNHAYLDKNGIS